MNLRKKQHRRLNLSLRKVQIPVPLDHLLVVLGQLALKVPQREEPKKLIDLNQIKKVKRKEIVNKTIKKGT